MDVDLAKNRNMSARRYLDELASNGRYHFSTEEAVEALSGSLAAVHARLRRLKEQGFFAGCFLSRKTKEELPGKIEERSFYGT